jgi:hypothetical protein
LNHSPHRNNLQLNKAIPLQGTIPTPGAALQGCLCKYPLTWAQALRRQPEQRARRQERPQFLPSLISILSLIFEIDHLCLWNIPPAID